MLLRRSPGSLAANHGSSSSVRARTQKLAPISSPAAPALWQQRRRRRPRSQRCGAAADSDAVADYTQTLIQIDADGGGDVMRVVEVLAEARVLKLSLPPPALEAGVRTLCAGGQWRRGADLFDSLRGAGGAAPSAATAAALLRALGEGGEVERAAALLTELRGSGGGGRALSAAFNVVVRAAARAGEVERAVALLSEVVEQGGNDGADDADDDDGRLYAEAATWSAVANAALVAGEHALAEEVLDMRDYL